MNTTMTRACGDSPPVQSCREGEVRPWLSNPAVLLRVLDEIDYGLIVATPDGTVRHANQIAVGALGRGPLRMQRGRLHASDAEEELMLMRALSDARGGRRRLISFGGAGGLPVAIIPLADEGSDAPDDELCLLVLGKQQTCEALTIDFFSRSHGLTGAEAAVLRGLCQGRKPKELARELGVALSTVRTQIGSVRDKTKTESIGELTLRLAVLPPITPALKGSLVRGS
jgi:DNA-binding CsgD family transcriptional regulator